MKELNVPRHQYIVATKLFKGAETYIPNQRGLSRKHLIEGARNSLKRLGLDYIDILFCQHYDEFTPVEETCKAVDWLIRNGLVLYWGTSLWTPSEIVEAHMIC